MEIIYCLIAIMFLIPLTVLIAAFYVKKRMNTILDNLGILKKNIHDNQRWMFDSLYSINHNVKLPDEQGPRIFKPAIVVCDKDDPMGEFDGRHDDYDR
jgi:hypothetical protein